MLRATREWGGDHAIHVLSLTRGKTDVVQAIKAPRTTENQLLRPGAAIRLRRVPACLRSRGKKVRNADKQLEHGIPRIGSLTGNGRGREQEARERVEAPDQRDWLGDRRVSLRAALEARDAWLRTKVELGIGD